MYTRRLLALRPLYFTKFNLVLLGPSLTCPIFYTSGEEVSDLSPAPISACGGSKFNMLNIHLKVNLSPDTFHSSSTRFRVMVALCKMAVTEKIKPAPIPAVSNPNI